MKKLFKFTIIAFLLSTLLPITSYAKVSKDNVKLDTAIGTASKDKERAIEAGKQMIGSVNYFMLNHARTNTTMLTYDYVNDSSSTGGLGIDCSEFIALIFNRGYGIQWGGDNANAQLTYGYVNASVTPKEYLHTITSWSEAKRGDIVLTNDFEHVVMYIGDGNILGSNGTSGTSSTTGPSISKAEYFPIAQGGYNMVRLPDKVSDAKGGILQKGHPSNDLTINGSSDSNSDKKETTGDSDSKYVGDDAWKNRMINFKVNTYEGATHGLQTGSNGFVSNAIIMNMNKTSNRVLTLAYQVMFVLSIAFFFFMFVSTIYYLVILPNGLGGMKMMNAFEKATGLNAYVSKDNTLDLLGRLGLSTFLVACIYANLIPLAISGVIKLGIMIFTLF